MTTYGDTRVWCEDCDNRAPSGACRAALRGERKDVTTSHVPPDYLPSHCVFFEPKAGAEDPRNGRQRFPHAFAAYVAQYGPAPDPRPDRIKALRGALGADK